MPHPCQLNYIVQYYQFHLFAVVGVPWQLSRPAALCHLMNVTGAAVETAKGVC